MPVKSPTFDPRPMPWRQRLRQWLGIEDAPIRISKTDIADGDCIIIQTDRVLSMPQSEHLREHVKLVIDALNVDAEVLVLSDGIDIKVLKTSQLPKRIDPAPGVGRAGPRPAY